MNQMTLTKTFLAAALAGGISLSASAQVLVNEDFEGYADTAAMLVNWAGGPGTLDPALGSPGQSASHPGGTVNAWQTAFSVTPTAANPVILSAQIYDANTVATGNRNTVGLRGGPFPLFEMGHYLDAAAYAVRINSFAGNENWVYFGGTTRTEGWHRYTATFTDTSVTVTLDLLSDGVVDSTINSVGATATGAFSSLRFGGPSNVASTGAANFDNIVLETVPEPSTYAAIFGGLALLGAFVYRRRLSVKK